MSNALIALIGVILAALLGLYWNFRNAKELRKQPFLLKQLELCLEASNVAATLATTHSKQAFDITHARFLELFWGPLSVVENEEVALAMCNFEQELQLSLAGGSSLPMTDLEGHSYELAMTVRKLILEAWRITTLEEVLQRKKS
jgi:hypothetical protein